MLLRTSPGKTTLTSRRGLAQCSSMVIMSARIWVGWSASVRPFHTGTPENRAKSKMGMHFVGLGPKELVDGVDQEVMRRVDAVAKETGAVILGGVLHALLLAHLAAAGVQVGDVGALLGGGHLEGAAGAGASRAAVG